MVWGESFRIDWQWRMNSDAASRNSTSIATSRIGEWRTLSDQVVPRRPDFRRDGEQYSAHPGHLKAVSGPFVLDPAPFARCGPENEGMRQSLQWPTLSD